jgi:hypothetical protein
MTPGNLSSEEGSKEGTRCLSLRLDGGDGWWLRWRGRWYSRYVLLGVGRARIHWEG